MKKLVKLVFAASAVLSISASAQGTQDIQANTPNSAYVQDGRGVIARNPFGLCWHAGYWTPADSVAGCDGEIVQAAAPVAAAPVAPAPVVVAAAPTSEKVTFAADAFFDFDKSVL